MSIGDGAQIASSAAAILDKRCRVCGFDVGSDTAWCDGVDDRGYRFVHERCRDWSALPFVYGRHLDVLRSVLRRGLAKPQHRPALEEAANKLAALRRRWPREALAVLEEGRAVLAEAHAVMVEAGVPARMRSGF